MSVGALCVRSVQIAQQGESVRVVTQRMAKQDVGTVVIVDSAKQPVGILTDRDVALRCVAQRHDPDATPVGALMTAPPICVRDTTPIEEALARMAGAHVRRLVVVDAAGQLVGILALDDVLELLVEETVNVGRLLHRRAPAAD